MLNQSFWDYVEKNRKLLIDGKFEEALNSSHIIYNVSMLHNNIRLMQNSTCDLGEIYSNISQPEKAIEYFKEEVALIKKYGAIDEDFDIALGVMYERIGFEYQYELKDSEAAIGYYEKAIKHYETGYINKGDVINGMDSVISNILDLGNSLLHEKRMYELCQNQVLKTNCFTVKINKWGK